MTRHHLERHRTQRVGWLRAVVLGANDGIVSTASLIVGVAAAHASRGEVFIAGMAGLVAGAMSMAAGEYVSVSSQADTEHADLERERKELETDYANEKKELVGIYVARGLSAALAEQVSDQLMTHDALGAHARDELGITDALAARPVLAAFSSAAAFATGAALPLLAALAAPAEHLVPVVFSLSLLVLSMMGALAARTGGFSLIKGIARVTFWGAFAMAVTAGIGALFGH